APLLWSDWMWRTGIGGSIPSMAAYVFAVVGVFRLTRMLLQGELSTPPASQTSAWIAAGVFAFNPNLLYLQATAMTESLYLALFIWATIYLADFLRCADNEHQTDGAWRGLFRCALCIAGAELTRYDGWFLAAMIGTIAVIKTIGRWSDPVLRAS